MSTNKQQQESNRSEQSTNFFDLFNRAATEWEGRIRMQAHRKKLRIKGTKKGMPNQNTKAVMHAVFTSACQTMNRLQGTNPALYNSCLEEGKYFCYTTLPSLQTIINKGKDFDDGAPSVWTIRRQIKLLLEMDIITDKINHRVTENRFADPGTADQLARGHGKIRLNIHPDVFQTILGQAAPSDSKNSPAPADSPNIGASCNLYSLSNKELKERITNTPDDSENNKALASAKLHLQNILGKVRDSKPLSTGIKNIPPANLAPAPKNFAQTVESSHAILSRAAQRAADKPQKAHTFALWQLLRAQLYAGETFNEDIRHACTQMLEQLLVQTQRSVRTYRKEQIEAFKNSAKYLDRAPKGRPAFLKWYQRQLPNIERSALEIVGNAIEIQHKHCEKNNYQAWRPVSYLSSEAAQRALGYSLENWTKLKKGFFNKNLASLERFKLQQQVQEIYSSIVKTWHADGDQQAHQLARKKYLEWMPFVQNNSLLSPSVKTELAESLVNKLKALFNHG
ncbi:MAG: hypothetical protein ACRBFS_24345 [Aureispira sp.]